MRAIIIDDKDSKGLLDALKLESLEGYCGRIAEIHNVPDSARKAMVDEIHRRFHYIVTKWLQAQGASGLQ